MHRRVSIVSVVFLGLVVANSLGCVANEEDSSLIILHNMAPTADCTTTPSRTELQLGGGVIDTNAPLGYVFTPLVMNTASTNMGQFRESQRLARIEGANIRIGGGADAIASLDGGLLSFSERFSFTVGPNDGLAALGFFILPVQTLSALRGRVGGGATVEVGVQLFGTMAGGDIVSNELVYPIFVCDGCLINDLGSCETLGPISPRTGGACQPLQDGGIVDCCTSASGNLVCPAFTNAPLPEATSLL